MSLNSALLVEVLPSPSTEDLKKIMRVHGTLFNIVEGDANNPTEYQAAKLIDKIRGKSFDATSASVDLPKLKDDQLRQALSAIPTDYWLLKCWTCRGAGHSAFTCPYLTMEQRLFFAYCFYRHQVETDPKLVEWFKAKAAARLDDGPDPGPKPKQPFRKPSNGNGNFNHRRGRSDSFHVNFPKVLARPTEENVPVAEEECDSSGSQSEN